MGSLRLIGILASLAACGAGAASAAAKDVPAAVVFVPPVDPAGVLALSPEIGATPAQRFTLTPAPLPPTFHSFAAALAAALEEPEPAPSAEGRVAAVPPAPPPPPSRPRATASAEAAPAQEPTIVAAAPPAQALPVHEPLDEREVVERANAYFTNLGTMIARFTQVGGDGRRLKGELYLQRPGKLRFEYDPPATLEVVADGSSVAVRDKKLATQDLYSISQTPLKFLLRERVNLGRDIRITDIEQDGDSARVTLEDRSTLGGTSQIVLYFDPKVEHLTQWRITDPQGFQTAVLLDKVDRSKQLDPSLFAISYDRVLNTDNVSR
jgi:outer membrane lipoprotein-sorting protein